MFLTQVAIFTAIARIDMTALCRRMRDGTGTRQTLERVALELFVSNGVAETTTRMIAEAAGVAEGTIYRHFSGKEELAWSLFAEHHRRIGRAVRETFAAGLPLRETVDRVVLRYCELADAHWLAFVYHQINMHRFLTRVERDEDNPVETITEAIRGAMAAGDIPKRDPDLVAGMALGVVLQAATHKLYGRVEGDFVPRAQTIANAVWGVVSAE